jgi:hypothetical protein
MKLENLSAASPTKTGAMGFQFRDPKPLAGVVVAGLYLYLASVVANLAAVAIELHALSTSHAGVYGGLLPGETIDLVAAVTRLATFGIYVIAGFMVLKWTYRVVANARVMSHGLGMTATPGWAIGWYFIPVANLWKPFEAVEQTWKVSHQPGAPSSVETPTLLRWWWALWLVSGIMGNLSGRLAMMEGPDLMLASDVAEMISDGAAIPLTLLLIRIVRAITEQQLTRKNVAEVFA